MFGLKTRVNNFVFKGEMSDLLIRKLVYILMKTGHSTSKRIEMTNYSTSQCLCLVYDY